MSENNENGGGCGRVCTTCLHYIRSIPSRIRDFPFGRCFLALLGLVNNRFVRSIIILTSTVLLIVSWFEFREHISNTVFVYCLALVICSFVSCIRPKGFLNKNYSQKRRQKRQCRQDVQVARPRARQRRIAHQPLAAGSGDAAEQEAAAPEYMQEAIFDFHHAEEPSASSVSSDELLHQAAPSNSGSNLLRLSTDPSTQSTHSTPLNAIKVPRNDEPLQEAAPSDSDSNLPRSSTDPSTQSTHSTPLDDVTNEKHRNDGPLQQAAPSDSDSNLLGSSTDPSIQSTRTNLDDVINEDHRNDGPLQQAAPSDSDSNLPGSSTNPSTQSTRSTSLDDATHEEHRNDGHLYQATPSDSDCNLPGSSTNPSTQSTHSTPLDDVTNEEPRNDNLLQQAATSDSDSNLPSSSTYPFR